MPFRIDIILLGGLLVAAPALTRRPEPPAAAGQADGPEISRSRGVEGGVVILWPRIIPATEAEETRALATGVQARLRRIVADMLPGSEIDVRPEPERVCPQGGCEGISVGALLMREDGGCAVVALVGGPGRSPVRLVPLVGRIRLNGPFVPFREPPESKVTITDFGRCSSLLDELPEHRSDVEAAIRALVRQTPPTNHP